MSATAVLSLLVGLAAFWIAMNALARARALGGAVRVRYGVVLIIKRERGISPTPLFRKLNALFIGIYAITLALAFYTFALSIYQRFSSNVPTAYILVPGINITGIDLLFFVINVAIGASLHELFHAKVASSNGIAVKGYGFMLVLLIPLAFVEVDENELARAPAGAGVSVLAAGPSANMILAVLAMSLLIASAGHGLMIYDVIDGSLAQKYGLRPYDVLLEINGTPISSSMDIGRFLSNEGGALLVISYWRAGEGVRSIEVLKPPNVTKLGVVLVPAPNLGLLEVFSPGGALAIISALSWAYVVNFSLALINALPFFISDGGRIAYRLLGKRGGALVNAFGASLLFLVLALGKI